MYPIKKNVFFDFNLKININTFCYLKIELIKVKYSILNLSKSE